MLYIHSFPQHNSSPTQKQDPTPLTHSLPFPPHHLRSPPQQPPYPPCQTLTSKHSIGPSTPNPKTNHSKSKATNSSSSLPSSPSSSSSQHSSSAPAGSSTRPTRHLTPPHSPLNPKDSTPTPSRSFLSYYTNPILQTMHWRKRNVAFV